MPKKKNSNLTAAKKAKNDEFYTQLSDIENEMEHYWPQFKGKTIFMNCDDPKTSWFWFYFAAQFEHLGIKKLISTHYDTVGPTYKMVLEKDTNGDGKIDGEDAIVTPLEGNGDFRSPECVALLDESDIVITNPPFSLFREYVKQLMDHGKKFLVIGSINAITYKEIFPLIKDDLIWSGYGFNRVKEFSVPNSYDTSKSVGTDRYGKKLIKVPGIAWFTNLDVKKRYEEYLLYKKYTPEEFPKYDNYDAINVKDTCDIPMDYPGIMGVPITFLDKYNPRQFEIVWLAAGNTRASTEPSILKEIGYSKNDNDRGGCGVVNGKRVYARILIRKRPEYIGEDD